MAEIKDMIKFFRLREGWTHALPKGYTGVHRLIQTAPNQAKTDTCVSIAVHRLTQKQTL